METMVLIGVDPHKATNAVAALDELGEVLERTEFPADRKGLRALERWAARILRRIRPRRDSRSVAESVRRQLASDLFRDVRNLNKRISELDVRIREEVETSATSLTELFGFGPILAAKIIGLVGDVSRFPGKGHFASYAGVAPVEVSSGEVVRHRLSLAGRISWPLTVSSALRVAWGEDWRLEREELGR